MQNVLSAGSHVLDDFLRADVLLAFDYDGTLAPITEDPEQAFMRPETRELLWQVAQRYQVIVVTGRAQPDALHRLRGVGVLEVIGNHGVEPNHAANRYVELVQRWRPYLERCVADWQGVILEDKIFSVALHYRRATDKSRARAALLRTARDLEDARVVIGKQVVNVVPSDAPHKGTALLRQQAQLQRARTIYVGDDETDEDVFRLSGPDAPLGIRVGPKRRSAAKYYIDDQAAIDTLLRKLIALRNERSDTDASVHP